MPVYELPLLKIQELIGKNSQLLENGHIIIIIFKVYLF